MLLDNSSDSFLVADTIGDAVTGLMTNMELPGNLTESDWAGYLTSWMESANMTVSPNATEDDIFGILTQNIARKSLVDQPSKLIALILSCIAILLNFCSLLAITRVKGRMTTNLRLLVSLSLSDILVSMCVLLFNFDPSTLSNSSYITCMVVGRRSLKMTSHLISLLNLIGLAFDHYFAIVRPLNYLTTMCPRRTNIMICMFWFISIVIGFSDFYVPFLRFSYCDTHYETMTYCESVWCAAYDSEYVVISVAFVIVVIMCCIYLRIYRSIKRYINFEGRHQRFVQRSRRALCTTLLVVGTFVVCWLPYCIFEMTISFLMLSNVKHTMKYFALVYKLDFYLYDLLLLNCLLDPIIYALRMREVRRGYERCLICIKQKPQRLRLIVRFSSANRRGNQASDEAESSRTSPRERLAFQMLVSNSKNGARCVRFPSRETQVPPCQAQLWRSTSDASAGTCGTPVDI